MSTRIRLLTIVAMAAVCALSFPGVATAAPGVGCNDKTDSTVRLDLKVLAGDTGRLEDAFGYYALPSGRPKGIVVFAHGHSNSAWKWRPILAAQAEKLGVITVAMDYRRQTFPGGDITRSSYGWRVREGAEDSIAAGRLFEEECLSKLKGPRPPIVMYGVSMGGNAAGLAVASKPTRADGSPLFDYWFDIEGATNVIETYLVARVVASPPISHATGQIAVKEIEEEMGGTLQERFGAYNQHAVVSRSDDIRASGIKGVVMVHGADDGSVPYNQSAEMFAALLAQRLPTDFFTVLRHGDGSSGNTLEDTLTLSSRIPGYNSPLTGHGGENDPTHPVIRTGFDRLSVLFSGQAPKCSRAFLVDDGSVLPDPTRFGLPACAG